MSKKNEGKRKKGKNREKNHNIFNVGKKKSLTIENKNLSLFFSLVWKKNNNFFYIQYTHTILSYIVLKQNLSFSG